MVVTSEQVGEKLNIYRAEARDNASGKHEYKKTMRPPVNVPYVVDNLWEWKRPEGFPSRRLSVYASPSPTLARKLGTKGSDVFLVKFARRCKLAQVIGYEDSKEHPDCRNLRKLLLKSLGQEWIDGSMTQKERAGRLWLPCLSKDEVESLFREVDILKRLRDRVFEAVTYWNDVILLKDGEGIPDPNGEVFFEAEHGYKLVPLRQAD